MVYIKILSSKTIFNTDNKKSFFSTKSAMISEGSCETEDI